MDLPSQVRKATLLKTKPELVIVQIWATTPCDGKDETRYADYQARVTEALQACRRPAEGAHSSPWATGHPRLVHQGRVELRARRPADACQQGVCSIFRSEDRKVVPEHVAYVRRTINGVQRRVRGRLQGRDDVPLRRRRGPTDRPEARTWRTAEASIQGLAKLAAVEWKVLYG